MGLKEADESKLLSRLEKLGRDVSALRFLVMVVLVGGGDQIYISDLIRAEQAKLNSGLDVCLGKADTLGKLRSMHQHHRHCHHEEHYSIHTNGSGTIVLENSEKGTFGFLFLCVCDSVAMTATVDVADSQTKTVAKVVEQQKEEVAITLIPFDNIIIIITPSVLIGII